MIVIAVKRKIILMSHGGSKRLTSWPKKNRLRKLEISLIQTQTQVMKVISKRRIAICPTPIARNSNKPMMKPNKLKRIHQAQIVMITLLTIQTKVQTQALILIRKTIRKIKWKSSCLRYQRKKINKVTMIGVRIKMKMRKTIKREMRMSTRTRNRMRKSKKKRKRRVTKI